MQPIAFFNYDRRAPLKSKKRLKKFICELFVAEGKEVEQIRYIFCSDRHLLGINRSFLRHDYYTDVIGFDLSGSKKKINAEIYISIDRVRDNARDEKILINNELLRVIFHGALHFCGYKDKRKKDKARMRAAENRYIIKYTNI